MEEVCSWLRVYSFHHIGYSCTLYQLHDHSVQLDSGYHEWTQPELGLKVSICLLRRKKTSSNFLSLFLNLRHSKLVDSTLFQRLKMRLQEGSVAVNLKRGGAFAAVDVIQFSHAISWTWKAWRPDFWKAICPCCSFTRSTPFWLIRWILDDLSVVLGSP